MVPGQKKLFLLVPVTSTWVQKGGVSRISYVTKTQIPIESTFTKHPQSLERFYES